MPSSSAALSGILMTVASPIVFGLGLQIIIYGLFIRHTLDAPPQSSESPTKLQRAAEVTRDLCAKWNGRWLGALLLLLSAALLFSGSTLLYGAKLGFGNFADTITNIWNSTRFGGFRWIGLGVLIFAAGVFANAMCWHTWRRAGRCRKCKYDMRHSVGVICPECGLDRTLKYRNKKLVALSLVIALIWPVAFAAQWGTSRYSLYGTYGLVPDWVLIMGMDVLPEDMIFGSKSALIPGGSPNVSLHGRIERYEDRITFERRVWRAIRDDIADPTTDPDVLMRRMTLAFAIPDAQGTFPDPEDPRTIRAVEVLSKEVLAFAKDENPRFDQWSKSPIFRMVSLREMARPAASIATDNDVAILLDNLSPRSFRASMCADILAAMREHREFIQHSIEKSLNDPGGTPSILYIRQLAATFARDDRRYARRILEDATEGHHDIRINSALILNRVDNYSLDQFFGHDKLAHVAREALLESDPELAVTGVVLSKLLWPSNDQKHMDTAIRTIFLAAQNGQMPKPAPWNNSLDWVIYDIHEFVLSHPTAELNLLATEGTLWLCALQPSLRGMHLEGFFSRVGYQGASNTRDPTIAALAALNDDVRWSDPEIEPMTWLPAAIEAAKKEFADPVPAQPGP